MEFFRLLKDVKEHRDQLQERYERAQRLMDQTRALESDLRIESAALAIQQGAPIELNMKNIAGVRIPTISAKEQAHDFPLYPNMAIQDLGLAYREVTDMILKLAARETALRKMLSEIRKTKRRTNALEHILIPKLEFSLRQIQSNLEEREREEFSRLKQRKR